jgi:hypothetical protein
MIRQFLAALIAVIAISNVQPSYGDGPTVCYEELDYSCETLWAWKALETRCELEYCDKEHQYNSDGITFKRRLRILPYRR